MGRFGKLSAADSWLLTRMADSRQRISRKAGQRSQALRNVRMPLQNGFEYSGAPTGTSALLG